MKPILTVFEHAPDRGRGLARDLRVRWALEEVGQPYEVKPVSFEALKEPGHLARNPFGQIPTWEQDGLVLFESGAIVLHLAQQHPGLLPPEPHARARATAWMFAALNTIEPTILERQKAVLLEGKESWTEQRMPQILARIRTRLGELSRHLGQADWLDGDFSAGDLLMVTTLRWLTVPKTGLVDDYPNLAAYVARAEARPAFQRAFAAQRAVFEAAPGQASERKG
jgi:glutathione S-transferase